MYSKNGDFEILKIIYFIYIVEINIYFKFESFNM